MYFNARETMHLLYNKSQIRMELEMADYQKRIETAECPEIAQMYQKLLNCVQDNLNQLQEAVKRRHVA